MRKSIMFSVIFVLGLSMILAGCSSGGGSNGKGDSSNKVTLNVTTTFSEDDPGHEPYEKLLEQFEDKHPDITIKRNDIKGNDKGMTKFETQWNGGEIPDVMFYFNDSHADFVYHSDKMVSMDKIMDDNPDWADQLEDTALDNVKTVAPNDELLNIPLNASYEGLIVNKKLFEDNNLDLPTDWDKFMEAIKTFQEKDIIPVSASMNLPVYLIEHAVLASGGAKSHAKGFEDEIPDSYVEGLDLIKDLYDKGAFPEDTLSLADDEAAQQYFQSGEAAMMLNGSWAIGDLPDDIADNSTVMPMPAPPNSSDYDGNQVISQFSEGWFVSQDAYDADKKEAAVEFLKFMTSKDADTKFANAYGAVPSVKGVEVEADTQAAKDGFEMAENASALEPSADSFVSEKVYNHMRDNISDVVTGKKSAKELLKEAQDKAIK